MGYTIPVLSPGLRQGQVAEEASATVIFSVLSPPWTLKQSCEKRMGRQLDRHEGGSVRKAIATEQQQLPYRTNVRSSASSVVVDVGGFFGASKMYHPPLGFGSAG